MSERYSMLWLDMTVSVKETEQSSTFERLFELHRITAPTSIDAAIAQTRPDVLCFDFDFPTRHGLKALQRIKRSHTGLPVMMLTVQHSEALAVWAFRSRVWDYLVKPLARGELERCLGCLAEMLSLRGVHDTPRRAAIPTSAIPEENRVRAPQGNDPLTLAPAISYVEANYREKLSSSVAAQRCRLSPFQFSRLFKETYGLTFSDYVLRFRIREACRLLRNPNAQVADVACLVGFNDPSYFSKMFRRYTSFSPSQFSETSGAALDPETLLHTLSGD